MDDPINQKKHEIPPRVKEIVPKAFKKCLFCTVLYGMALWMGSVIMSVLTVSSCKDINAASQHHLGSFRKLMTFMRRNETEYIESVIDNIDDIFNALLPNMGDNTIWKSNWTIDLLKTELTLEDICKLNMVSGSRQLVYLHSVGSMLNIHSPKITHSAVKFELVAIPLLQLLYIAMVTSTAFAFSITLTIVLNRLGIYKDVARHFEDNQWFMRRYCLNPVSYREPRNQTNVFRSSDSSSETTSYASSPSVNYDKSCHATKGISRLSTNINSSKLHYLHTEENRNRTQRSSNAPSLSESLRLKKSPTSVSLRLKKSPTSSNEERVNQSPAISRIRFDESPTNSKTRLNRNLNSLCFNKSRNLSHDYTNNQEYYSTLTKPRQTISKHVYSKAPSRSSIFRSKQEYCSEPSTSHTSRNRYDRYDPPSMSHQTNAKHIDRLPLSRSHTISSKYKYACASSKSLTNYKNICYNALSTSNTHSKTEISKVVTLRTNRLRNALTNSELACCKNSSCSSSPTCHFHTIDSPNVSHHTQSSCTRCESLNCLDVSHQKDSSFARCGSLNSLNLSHQVNPSCSQCESLNCLDVSHQKDSPCTQVGSFSSPELSHQASPSCSRCGFHHSPSSQRHPQSYSFSSYGNLRTQSHKRCRIHSKLILPISSQMLFPTSNPTSVKTTPLQSCHLSPANTSTSDKKCDESKQPRHEAYCHIQSHSSYLADTDVEYLGQRQCQSNHTCLEDSGCFRTLSGIKKVQNVQQSCSNNSLSNLSQSSQLYEHPNDRKACVVSRFKSRNMLNLLNDLSNKTESEAIGTDSVSGSQEREIFEDVLETCRTTDKTHSLSSSNNNFNNHRLYSTKRPPSLSRNLLNVKRLKRKNISLLSMDKLRSLVTMSRNPIGCDTDCFSLCSICNNEDAENRWRTEVLRIFDFQWKEAIIIMLILILYIILWQVTIHVTYGLEDHECNFLHALENAVMLTCKVGFGSLKANHDFSSFSIFVFLYSLTVPHILLLACFKITSKTKPERYHGRKKVAAEVQNFLETNFRRNRLSMSMCARE